MRRAVVLALIAGCSGRSGAQEAGGSEPPNPLLEPNCTAATGTRVILRQVVQTTAAALLVTSPPKDPRRFVLEQPGRIRILDEAGGYQPLASSFLDISRSRNGPINNGGGEGGLLGLAFHPRYADNGTFYVFYTTTTTNVLASYQVRPGDPDHADPTSAQILISIPDFAGNHNGGMIEFGSDGLLYIGTGDGGGGGDPMLTGQNPDALLGKILRIDVDHPRDGKPYGIPTDNPYAAGGGAPEVFMLGLRNPWRWSFDIATGDMWIGDVGQGSVEELDVVRPGTGAGKNFGWSNFEGSLCIRNCGVALEPPQVEQHHVDGFCAIIGGQVYRGACYPDLRGRYWFTDNCQHDLYAATLQGDGSVTTELIATSFIALDGVERAGFPQSPASLHQDARGELYLTTTGLPTAFGGVWHLEVAP